MVIPTSPFIAWSEDLQRVNSSVLKYYRCLETYIVIVFQKLNLSNIKYPLSSKLAAIEKEHIL